MKNCIMQIVSLNCTLQIASCKLNHEYAYCIMQIASWTKLDQVQETKLLGLVLRDDLSWKSNSAELTKRAYSRMLILKNLVKFDVPLVDLVQIYILYIRSVMEQSAVVWHPAITKGEQRDIERTQKVALRVILGQNYISYENSLQLTGLDTLTSRRKKISLNFAKKCVKNEKTQWMFPLNKRTCTMETRHPEKFKVIKEKIEKLTNSTIPYMQRLLNAEFKT